MFLKFLERIGRKKIVLDRGPSHPRFDLAKPWEMETKYQETINTIIGKNYPKPIVIHEEARTAALKAFQSLKKN